MERHLIFLQFHSYYITHIFYLWSLKSPKIAAVLKVQRISFALVCALHLQSSSSSSSSSCWLHRAKDADDLSSADCSTLQGRVFWRRALGRVWPHAWESVVCVTGCVCVCVCVCNCSISWSFLDEGVDIGHSSGESMEMTSKVVGL